MDTYMTLVFRAARVSPKHAALVDIDPQQWPTSIMSRREDYLSTTSLHVRDTETLSLPSSSGTSMGHGGVSGSEAWQRNRSLSPPNLVGSSEYGKSWWMRSFERFANLVFHY